MSLTKDQILAEARALNPVEQEELAESLWLIAHGETKESVETAWAEEIRRRIDRADRGEGSSVPVDEAIAEIRKKLPR